MHVLMELTGKTGVRFVFAGVTQTALPGGFFFRDADYSVSNYTPLQTALYVMDFC